MLNDTNSSVRNRSTIPAPRATLLVPGDLMAQYVAASERARAALAEQAALLAQLQALEGVRLRSEPSSPRR